MSELLILSLRLSRGTNSFWLLVSAVTFFRSISKAHDQKWGLKGRLTGKSTALPFCLLLPHNNNNKYNRFRHCINLSHNSCLHYKWPWPWDRSQDSFQMMKPKGRDKKINRVKICLDERTTMTPLAFLRGLDLIHSPIINKQVTKFFLYLGSNNLADTEFWQHQGGILRPLPTMCEASAWSLNCGSSSENNHNQTFPISHLMSTFIASLNSFNN